jgi:hypothetical protein
VYRWGRDMFPITVRTLSQVPPGRKAAQIEVAGLANGRQRSSKVVSTIAHYYANCPHPRAPFPSLSSGDASKKLPVRSEHLLHC